MSSRIFSTITWSCQVFIKLLNQQTLKYFGVQMLENCNGGSILMRLSELYECQLSQKLRKKDDVKGKSHIFKPRANVFKFWYVNNEQ